jgi:hypothetical protein
MMHHPHHITVTLHASARDCQCVILVFVFHQAYSKDGLAAAANNDPETRAKMEVMKFSTFFSPFHDVYLEEVR